MIAGAAVAAALIGPLMPRLSGWALGQPGVPPAGAVERRLGSAALAVVSAVLVWRIGLDPALPAYLVFGLAAVVLAVVDLRYRRLPDRLVAAAAAAGVVLLTGASVVTGAWERLAVAVGAALVVYVVHLLAHLASAGALGGGDVTFAAVVALHTGWLGVHAALAGVLLGYLIALLAGSVIVLLRLMGPAAVAIPFGPAIAAGGLVAVAVFG